MLTNTFIENVKVGNNGWIVIPQNIREVLGVSNGDRITFVVENGSVRLINSVVYAMQMLQAQVAGEAAEAGLTSDEEVMNLVKEVRTKKA